MSLADFTAMARMASSTVMVSPGCRPSLEGAMLAAWAETTTMSLGFSRPVASASKVRYSVMILVIDAG